MKIHFSNGTFKEVVLNDSSYRLRAIMQEDTVNLKFSLSEYFEFPLGCYIEYQGQTYTMNTPCGIKEINTTNFEYTMTLGGFQNLLKNFLMKDTQGRLKFPITAKPSEHLELIIHNLNQNTAGGWVIGDYLDADERPITYSHTNCYNALVNLASAYKTEFEIIGKTINFKKTEYNYSSPLALSYGKGNGFVSGVCRKSDNTKADFNILYIQGGEKNIDISTYGNKTLLLPKNQTLEYNSITYRTSLDGLFIFEDGADLTNRREHSLDLTNMYPKRVGEVTGVIEVDASKNFYDFKDSSIPNAMDFSNYRIEGEKITIKFESGMLAGKTFDIEQGEKSTSGYIHSQRRFKLVPKDDDGRIMPDTIFKPEVGDKYAVFGMSLPSAYIIDNSTKTGTSWDLFKEACKNFYENSNSDFNFNGKLDGIWAKKDWLNIGGKIRIGGYILFTDANFQVTGVKIRIKSVKDYINNPFSPEIELSNSTQSGSITSVLDKINANEVIIEQKYRDILDYTKRRFRDSLETMKMLAGAKLEFDKGINPITVQTMQMLVGDETLQFDFINSLTDETRANHQIVYNDTSKVLTLDEGVLKHFTLGIEAIKPKHSYKKWKIPMFVSPPLTDINKSYYVYAKVDKGSTNGVFYLSETPIGLEEEVGVYHLLVGLLNTEFEGSRSFAKMYGFTEILPGEIKVDRLSSSDGSQYIELKDDRIEVHGKVAFIDDMVDNRVNKNLLLDYKNLNNWLFYGAVNVIDNTITAPNRYYAGVYQDIAVLPNTEYTISFNILSLTGVGSLAIGGNALPSMYSGLLNHSITLGLNEITFNTGSNSLIRIRLVLNATNSFKVESVQLEKGIIGTDHEANITELTTVQNIANKTDFLKETSVVGNTVCTGNMLVGNENGANAGVTGEGTTGDSVRFYAGSDFNGRNTAPFRVNDKGEVVMTKADVSGRINATSGKIKDLSIGENFKIKENNNADATVFYGVDPRETGRRENLVINSRGLIYIKDLTPSTDYIEIGMGYAGITISKGSGRGYALEILDGEIVVGSEVGFTGVKKHWVHSNTYLNFKYVKGIFIRSWMTNS